jgi:hypothetical protein
VVIMYLDYVLLVGGRIGPIKSTAICQIPAKYLVDSKPSHPFVMSFLLSGKQHSYDNIP